MFGRRKPTQGELAELILQGVSPKDFAPKLYEAALGKHNPNAKDDWSHLARGFGRRLKSADDIMILYKAVPPPVGGSERYLKYDTWLSLSREVARGYWETAGVKDSKEATMLCRFLLAHEQKELIKQALPLLIERKDILDFACVLSGPELLMIFAIALGYVPINSFDEAIQLHREQLRLEEEARRLSAGGGL